MIDLYSDTMTRPTQAMRDAIASAQVGDEQRGEDPTTARLEEQAARLVGMSHALYLPSASMANAIAVQLHCAAGDELLSAENGHVACFEGGGPAVHARAMLRGIPTESGIFGPGDITGRLRPGMPHCPTVRLVVVENTTNIGGGQPWPQETLQQVVAAARHHGLSLHLDGSRLLHAAIAQHTTALHLAHGFDTVTLCLSKGLGAPMGAILAFPEAMAERARRLKHLMGGALRQSGMMAAAGLYALEHHVDRLEEDHRKAARLAEGLAQIPGVTVEAVPVRTNMVFFRYPGEGFAQKLAQRNLRFSQVGPDRYRAVTHLDVSPEQIERAIEIVREVAA